jgi:arylsulfatase A
MKIRILLLAAILPLSLQIHAEDKPNIILIMLDDLGWKDLRCQGNDQIDTPNIDRFFKQGMHFTDAYSASPVCSPTRAAIITGQSPARLGITQHGPNDDRFGPKKKVIREAETSGALPLEQVTVAERLKSKGYATAFIGKWHLSDTKTRESKGKDDPAFWPDHQGFDINLGGCGKGGPPTFFDPYNI